MRVTNTHIYFWHGYLSNWFMLNNPIFLDDFYFYTSEQLFMYLKAIHFNDYEIAKKIVEQGKDPDVAKELGRKVKYFDSNEWDEIKTLIMYNTLRLKFENNSDLRKKLINTGNKILVEASPYDKIWGIGLHYNDDAVLNEKNWKGENLLGKTLMDVRELYL